MKERITISQTSNADMNIGVHKTNNMTPNKQEIDKRVKLTSMDQEPEDIRKYTEFMIQELNKIIMTPSEILMKHEDANEYHFHEVDRKWIIEAMEEYAKTRSEKLDVLARLLAKSWFYGKFEWETPNERVMQMIMQELGYYPFKNEDEMIRETKVDEDFYKQAVEQIKTR